MPKHAIIPDRECSPYCSLFPDLPESDFAELVESISENGQRMPIQLDADGKILDGVHRYKACQKLFIRPKLKKWRGPATVDDYARYVLAANIHRRHLTASQRAMIAEEISKLLPNKKLAKDIGETHRAPGAQSNDAEACIDEEQKRAPGAQSNRISASKMAKIADVSPRTMQQARQVAAEAPELVPAVVAGDMSLKAALKTVTPADVDDPPITDSFGHVLSDAIARTFMDSEILERLKADLRRIRREITDLFERNAEIVTYIHQQAITADLKNAETAIKFGLPYCLCPKCGGDKCEACRRTGWMPKPTYDQTIPQELKYKA